VSRLAKRSCIRNLCGIAYLLWILCAGQVLIWAWTLFTPITFSWQFADGESLDSWTTYDGFIQFQVNHGVLDIHKKLYISHQDTEETISVDNTRSDRDGSWMQRWGLVLPSINPPLPWVGVQGATVPLWPSVVFIGAVAICLRMFNRHVAKMRNGDEIVSSHLANDRSPGFWKITLRILTIGFGSIAILLVCVLCVGYWPAPDVRVFELPNCRFWQGLPRIVGDTARDGFAFDWTRQYWEQTSQGENPYDVNYMVMTNTGMLKLQWTDYGAAPIVGSTKTYGNFLLRYEIEAVRVSRRGSYVCRDIQVSLWGLAMLFGAYPAIALFRGPVRRWRRLRRGVCLQSEPRL
jgi:hypothetical protein